MAEGVADRAPPQRREGRAHGVRRRVRETPGARGPLGAGVGAGALTVGKLRRNWGRARFQARDSRASRRLYVSVDSMEPVVAGAAPPDDRCSGDRLRERREPVSAKSDEGQGWIETQRMRMDEGRWPLVLPDLGQRACGPAGVAGAVMRRTTSVGRTLTTATDQPEGRCGRGGLEHEGQEAREDGADGPHGVPRLGVEARGAAAPRNGRATGRPATTGDRRGSGGRRGGVDGKWRRTGVDAGAGCEASGPLARRPALRASMHVGSNNTDA